MTATVAAVSKEMQQRTQRHEQKRKRAEQVRAMLGQQEERGDRKKTQQGDCKRRAPAGSGWLVVIVTHGVFLMGGWCVAGAGGSAHTGGVAILRAMR